MTDPIRHSPMPFHPLPENSPDEKPRSADLGLLVIRVFSAASFLYYQLLDQLQLAWNHVWSQAEWDLAAQLAEKSIPFPGIVSAAVTLAGAVAFLGIAAGIFTRINGIVLFLLTGVALLLPVTLSTSLTPQALVLYLAVFLALALGGAGRFSLDHLLAGRKAKKR